MPMNSYNNQSPWLKEVVLVFLANLRSFLAGDSVRFRRRGQTLRVDEGPLSFSYGSARRGIHKVRKAGGLRARGAQLRDSYLLTGLSSTLLRVVDVGANSGEMLLALPNEMAQYLAIEPASEEFLALSKNCKQWGTTPPLNLAVSDHAGVYDFYISLEGGDSSLHEPSCGYSEIRKIKTESLDNIVRLAGSDWLEGWIDLVKVETEGNEYEVLLGASATLERTRLVVVDGGPERGVEQKSTIERCTQLLIQSGFELVALNLGSRPGVGLFRNTRADSWSRW